MVKASELDLNVTSQGLILIGIFCVIYWRAEVLNCILTILGGETTTKMTL